MKVPILTSFFAVFCASAVGVSSAGSLTPPPGPVAPTPGPEPRTPINATSTPGDADSLFKITQPGSYYLTANITGVVGKHGIEIEASGVTIDLMGFDLAGVPAMGTFDGVIAASGTTNIALINGSIRNWGDRGVELASVGGRVEGVLASGNASSGIHVGFACTIADCLAISNLGSGIDAGESCNIRNCTAWFNSGNGISTGNNGSVNTSTAFGNVLHGINTNSTCTIASCSAHSNTGNGINVGSVPTNGAGSTISNCAANMNAGSGIRVGPGCMVANCSTRQNSIDGILCNSQSTIRGNTCSFNGIGTGDGAGIHATAGDNRIEGNNCTLSDRGVDVDQAGNVIIQNTCSGNGVDWDIAANNVVGPIIDRRAPASAVINGFSAPSSLGSTEPNANFSY